MSDLSYLELSAFSSASSAGLRENKATIFAFCSELKAFGLIVMDCIYYPRLPGAESAPWYCQSPRLGGLEVQ
ncbi:hypothetical protein [Pseudomonas cannabina]|uniref:hypothetical protein n=1 Tax=Pseudomonas cannabina TaxID=86840 RepID=UPI000EFFFDA0|nr:hypothetical protein [Pseudomonas cannabina]